ncbi:hypothetical protein M2360_003682 [Rhizobium sp. SG_E_25_P2]|uniref:hypothetical protein n=1 Tax=Rhizobium sp. SG_E_25_P2 TaxID=2879942 RepID=UPI002476F21F|nr:hypothetical protein [Rhizobium sp. SG_E_25_P2]MDH6268277.1 hypothetical protein [Rhizobium sp. SG_E_25_P2]
MTTPSIATRSNEKCAERMSRKQFNGFLYDLFECKGDNSVTADALYEAEDFYVEVFANSPAGLMIAVHHGFAGFNYQTVDVYRPATDKPFQVVSQEAA